MLTRYWEYLKYHEKQSRLWRTSARFVVVVAGRGSGKTELARRRIVRFLPIKKRWPTEYFYALPTFGQARRVAWEPIRRLIPDEWIDKENESSMTVKTIFGSTLRVIGLDRPMRAEGLQYDGGIMDEMSDQRPGVFDKTFRPALTHRKGWCWMVGVPKRFGVGAPEFRKRYDDWVKLNDGIHEAYTWPSDGVVDPAELIVQQGVMDPKDFREQFGALWESVAGLVYYCFDEKESIVSDVKYDPDAPLMIGSDFNVDPMAWVVVQARSGNKAGSKLDELVVIDEVWEKNTNTQKTLDVLYARYSEHRGGWYFFGDATGKARRSSASSSDYAQIRNDVRFKGAKVSYPDSNPAVHDRVASVNAMLKTADGVRRLRIHKRCEHLIRDLGYLSYNEGSRDIDDRDPKAKHITDALGYLVHRLCPLRSQLETSSPGVSAHGA